MKLKALLPIACCLLPLVLSSCGHSEPPPEEQIGFYVSSQRDVLRTKRAMLVELRSNSDCPSEIPPDMTKSLAEAIQRLGLFQVDVLKRDTPACRDLPLDRDTLTLQELALVRQTLACDAVILGEVTQFQSHPRMQLGLKLRLLDLRNGKLVWGIDHTWDGTRRATQYRIQQYFQKEVRDYEPLNWEFVVNSPRAFEQFVAWDAASTLPSRYVPMPVPAAPQAPPARPSCPPPCQKLAIAGEGGENSGNSVAQP